MKILESWGRYPRVSQQSRAIRWRGDPILADDSASVLPFGKGRSYGDCCLNEGGTLLQTEALDRVISFDTDKGILRAEAGMTLAQVLDLIVPLGWFLPVSPGTKFVSLGGAVANDVHGKNHHIDGTFGRHVHAFELLRSDGSQLYCSPAENSELFSATIAGLGLTGLILWVELQLQPISSAQIEMESIKFEALDEFFSISQESPESYPYTVSWLDCLSKEGRGIFMRGKHSQSIDLDLSRQRVRRPKVTVPLDAPSIALHHWNMKLFNKLYYGRQFGKVKQSTVHYDPFFYPLDAVSNWNRMYGKNGFFQFQCVIPDKNSPEVIEAILAEARGDGSASFLAVLKEFGDSVSPGIMSFPCSGTTLCLDFPNRGSTTKDLLLRMDAMVREAGGRIYPAKDAVMPPESFKQYFPRWKEFSDYIDPRFSSSFWRRVMGEQ